MPQSSFHSLINLFAASPPQHFSAGHQLLSPHQTISHLFLLESGQVRQYTVAATGEEISIHVFAPQSVIPLMLVLIDQPNRFYFQTQTPISVKTLPVSQVTSLIDTDPHLQKELLIRFAEAVNGLTLRIESLLSAKQRDQLFSLLHYFAVKHGTKNKSGHLVLDLKLTHQDLANWLGTARETITRHLSNLEKDGFIKLHRHQLTLLKSPKNLS